MRKQERINRKIKKKMETAKTVYLMVYYGKWYIREYKFADSFGWDEHFGDYVPRVYHRVYHFDDRNGTYEVWDIRNITNTTTGRIFSWTFSRERAEDQLNTAICLEAIGHGNIN